MCHFGFADFKKGTVNRLYNQSRKVEKCHRKKYPTLSHKSDQRSSEPIKKRQRFFNILINLELTTQQKNVYCGIANFLWGRGAQDIETTCRTRAFLVF